MSARTVLDDALAAYKKNYTIDPNAVYTLAEALATYIDSEAGGAVVWGAIGGTLANQTDLQADLTGKQNSINTNTTNIASNTSSIANKADIQAAAAATTTITFTTDTIFGTTGTPLTGNITSNVTGGKKGVTALIIHNDTGAPTFDSNFHLLSGSGSYVTGQINYIFCQFIDSTHILYSINQ